MRWILWLLILYRAANVLILQFAGNTRQVELQSACSLMLVALSVLDLLLPTHYMMSHTHTYTLYLEESFEHDVYDLVLLVDVVQLY